VANLIVSVYVRLKTGNRPFVPATGKADQQGSFYIQHCRGSKPILKFIGKSYDEAVAAKIKMERHLDAVSRNLIVPEEMEGDTKKNHRILDVINTYIADQSKADQNGEYMSKKSLNSKRSELEKFAAATGKTYVEEITRKVLIDFRDKLNSEGYQRDTTYNKMMTAVTFLKHNGAVPYTRLLLKTDWPEKKDTNPDPYTDEEIQDMISFATHDEEILIRFFAASGMREGEVSVAELEDIVVAEKYIQVQRIKPLYDWKRKNKAAVRRVYLGDDLLATLLKRGPGLLFPKNRRRNTHILRTIERLAELAKVTPTTAKKATHPEACKDDWCHRFRDTWFSTQVGNAADVNDLRGICKQGGHSDLRTLDAYAQLRKANDPRTRAAANVSDRFAAKPQLVKAG
jgi:integrase